jgi:predicted glycoside hydrolase/deacetylase ChbG (UPF0249 family)
VRRLIVNADDYGLTEGVNRAVRELAAAGALTSATLMAGAGAAQSAAIDSHSSPGLGVGCHVVLLDGEPVAAQHSVSSLLKPGTQAFYPTLGEFLRALFLGKIQQAHIAVETAAQLKRLLDLGIQPTHVDTHKHTHMFPQVLGGVLSAAAKAGVRAIRNPMEPAWAVTATRGAPALRKLEVTALRVSYGNAFLEKASHTGFATTDGAIGVAATGSLEAQSLRALLAAMPEGTWELVCHPGYVDRSLDGITTRLRESREVEKDCLLHLPEILPGDTKLIHFGDLVG